VCRWNIQLIADLYSPRISSMVHGNTVPAAQAAIRDRDTVKVKVSFALGLRTPRVGRVGIEYRLPVADA